MLGKFLRLASYRVFCVPSKDAYEFLVICKDSLCNLGLIETRSVEYTIFSLDLVVDTGGEIILIPIQLDLPL